MFLGPILMFTKKNLLRNAGGWEGRTFSFLSSPYDTSSPPLMQDIGTIPDLKTWKQGVVLFVKSIYSSKN